MAAFMCTIRQVFVFFRCKHLLQSCNLKQSKQGDYYAVKNVFLISVIGYSGPDIQSSVKLTRV